LLLALANDCSYALGNNEGQKALATVNLQLKWHHQFQFAGYYAAKTQGFYRDEGLNVNIIEGGNNKSASTLVSNNVVQYGVSDSEILLDYINGKPLVVLGAIFQHSPYILLSLKDANINTPSDLIGKRVMIGDSQGAVQIKAMLKHEGIELSQLKILPHSWNIQDLIQKKVDAVSAYATVEPNFLKSKGIAPSILNSTNYGVDFYGDTLFTNQTELKNHPDRVAAFLRATKKGWEYALEHQEATAETILKLDGVKNRGITKALLLDEARSMEPLISHDVVEIGHINPWRWKHIANEFAGLGYIKKDYDLSNFIYDTNKAKPALSRPQILLITLLSTVLISLIGFWFTKQRRKLNTTSKELDVEVIRRQEAEIKLQKSQVELNEVFKKTAAGIAATDINGKYLLVNPAFCKMLGYTEEELLKKDFSSVTYKEDLLVNQHEVQKIVDGLSNDFTIEKQYVKKDGNLVWARASVSGVRDANNKIEKLIAVTEDITEKIATDIKLTYSENLLKIAGGLAKLGGWDIDLKAMEMRWSDEVSIMHDLPPGITPSVEEGFLMIEPEFRSHIQQVFDDCIRFGHSYDEEFQKTTAKNRLIWVRSVGNAVRDEHGNIVRIEGAFQEITAYKNLEIFNRKQSLILEDIASGAPLISVLEACVKLIENQYPDLICAVNFIDEQGLRLKTGTSFNLPTEYLDAIDGILIGDSVGSCGTAAFHQKEVIVNDIATSSLWENYKELALKHHLLACWSWPLISSKNKVIGTFAAYSRAVSEPTEEKIKLIRSVAKTAAIAIEKERASEQIQYLAFYDVLTGLPNRLLLQDRLQHAIANCVRNYKYGALLFIDIDNFKTINDTIGHSAGDILLKKIGERFVASTRHSDTIARIGGDEFIILLEEIATDAADAAIQSQTFAEKLIKSFKQPFEIDNHLYHSSPSIGITLFQGEQQSVSELLKQADLAMYQAKAAGRNTLRFYDPTMQTSVTNRVQLENDIREGIKKNEFILHYQPQFNHLNQCIGAEALVRWNHSTKGMVSPVEFIPLAEETLLIIPIGNYVLKTACETLVRWQTMPQLANISLAVNISVNQFRQSDFVMQVKKIIKRSGVNPSLLELELTESLFAENIDDIIQKMTALKKLGIKFSLDDFGTGYSSLNYLKRLPLNQLKIDQSFVSDILVNSHDASICRSVITLAKSLDLEVIAEGVERLDQKELLYQQGCNSYQGYYFSKPLPIDALEGLIIKQFDLNN
jgi:diguanylate cyclase (GGDEF)-like protein/PAS domain S-box-containing protein